MLGLSDKNVLWNLHVLDGAGYSPHLPSHFHTGQVTALPQFGFTPVAS